ncbi:hypothetical protein Nepgr_021187 [Nepenthes gracilis]|uniref:Uncharacterized protein n=1 Tax=Nepenthes gracilis TaxID=150966 RepID=A0AAD3SYM9_NEPGR|nr:hypothetical protein Nepgr_021187 [Nepenthes gracilis]
MEKELVELFEAAKKAADAAAMDDGSVDETRCLDALQRLKDFPVNYQILVTTQVLFTDSVLHIIDSFGFHGVPDYGNVR